MPVGVKSTASRLKLQADTVLERTSVTFQALVSRPVPVKLSLNAVVILGGGGGPRQLVGNCSHRCRSARFFNERATGVAMAAILPRIAVTPSNEEMSTCCLRV